MHWKELRDIRRQYFIDKFKVWVETGVLHEED